MPRPKETVAVSIQPPGSFCVLAPKPSKRPFSTDNRQIEGDENDQQHVLADDPLQQKPLQVETNQEGDR
jgi:hypothetical protein